jgi:hypothetical protein
MSGWVIGLAWLVLSSVFLLDGLLMTGLMAERPSTRRLWLTVPVLFAPGALLLTPWRGWVLAGLGVAALVHLAAHGGWMLWLSRRLMPAPACLEAEVHAMARRFGTPAPARVALGPLGPAVVGLWRQVLVVPAAVADLSEGARQAVLAHELAHVARRDSLRLWLIGVAATLLGWHPAARRVLAALRLELEMAADDRAVAWLGDARQYVLVVGRWGLLTAGQPLPWGAALVAEPSDLSLRLRALVEPMPATRLLRLPGWVGPKRTGKPTRRVWWAGYRYRAEVLIGALAAGYLALFGLVLWLV